MGTAYTGPRKVYEPSKPATVEVISKYPMLDATERSTHTDMVLDNELSGLRSRK
jgi:hypothetical protein